MREQFSGSLQDPVLTQVHEVPIPTQPEAPAIERINPFHDATRKILRKVINAENPDALPEALGADKVPERYRGDWLAELKASAQAELAERDAGKKGGSFKPLNELNTSGNAHNGAAAQEAKAAAPATAPEPAPKQKVGERIDSATAKATGTTQNVAGRLGAPAQQTKTHEKSKHQTEAEKYDAKYAAMPEGEVLEIVYEISVEGNHALEQSMPIEERKALRRAYDRSISNLHAKFDQVEPSVILSWNESKDYQPPAFKHILNKRAEQARAELNDKYLKMDSEDIFRAIDGGIMNGMSQAEFTVFKPQLDRALNELKAELREMSPQEIISLYEKNLGDPKGNLSPTYMSILGVYYRDAQEALKRKDNGQAAQASAAHESQQASSEAADQAQIDAWKEKYHNLDEVGVLRVAEKAFAGELSDAEFEVFAHEYQSVIRYMHDALGKMPYDELIKAYEDQAAHADTLNLPAAYEAIIRPYYEAAKQKEREIAEEAQRRHAAQNNQSSKMVVTGSLFDNEATKAQPHVPSPEASMPEGLTPAEFLKEKNKELLANFDPHKYLKAGKDQIKAMPDALLEAMIDYATGPARFKKLDAEYKKLSKKLMSGFLGLSVKSRTAKVMAAQERLREIESEISGIQNRYDNSMKTVQKRAFKKEDEKRRTARNNVEQEFKGLWGYAANDGKLNKDLQYKLFLGIAPEPEKPSRFRKDRNKLVNPKRMNLDKKRAYDNMVLETLKPEVVFKDVDTAMKVINRLSYRHSKQRFIEMAKYYAPEIGEQFF